MGYTGKPNPQQIPAFCGKCHSDANLMKKFDPALRVDQVQEYFETYIPQFCKPESKVKFFFDVYDVEEGVL
jgi:hypothetical protein